jgi:hypothetical protein
MGDKKKKQFKKLGMSTSNEKRNITERLNISATMSEFETSAEQTEV